MSNSLSQALTVAALRILRPLVRILLRNGVSYRTFADLAKWAYVDVATREFGLPGRKQSVSRVAVLTGLSRKEVSRVQAIANPDDRPESERYNRAARVISGWLTDPEFLTARGQPRQLPPEGEGASFAQLVRRYSGDMPARAVMDELLRVGAIRRLDSGRLQLQTRAYVPEESAVDKLHILGTDTGALIATIDHNLDPETAEPYFQRKVLYDNLPDEALPAFRALSAEQGQQLLERLNAWLREQDRDTNPAVRGKGRNTAGIGIYYFENPDGQPAGEAGDETGEEHA